MVRGEIDNRVKGIVRGKIWVEGREAPVILELKGNAWPDLAGCLLTFTNPRPREQHEHLDNLHPEQRGEIGDLTASRKVRVFDLPIEEALAMIRRGEKPSEHMANSLYLEWFSEHNGRVVIESADYELSVSAPEWRMPPEENAERAQQAAAGMDGFVRAVSAAMDPTDEGEGLEDEEEEEANDDERAWNEHDYEKFLKECDARTEKYGRLLEKYGDSDDAEEKIAEEMGWARELTEEEAEEDRRRIEEINAACEAALEAPEPEPEPHLEGIDWIRDEKGRLRHPLQNRCHEGAMRFWQIANNLEQDRPEDDDLERFLFEWQVTAAKLAGALTGVAEGRGFQDGAFVVAYLKRALNHLHESHAGLQAVAEKKLLPEAIVAEARQEILEIREGILALMDRYRGRES